MSRQRRRTTGSKDRVLLAVELRANGKDDAEQSERRDCFVERRR